MLYVISVVCNHVPLSLESPLVSFPADTIAADFTDYSFKLSHRAQSLSVCAFCCSFKCISYADFLLNLILMQR